jgi:hypothetical protein
MTAFGADIAVIVPLFVPITALWCAFLLSKVHPLDPHANSPEISLVDNLLTISKIRKILGSFGAEDFWYLVVYQSLNGQWPPFAPTGS